MEITISLTYLIIGTSVLVLSSFVGLACFAIIKKVSTNSYKTGYIAGKRRDEMYHSVCDCGTIQTSKNYERAAR